MPWGMIIVVVAVSVTQNIEEEREYLLKIYEQDKAYPELI